MIIRLASLSILSVISVFFLFACAPEPEYRSDGQENVFVIQKIKGRKTWGLVDRNPRAGESHQIIPCQYDTIFSLYKNPLQYYGLFIAIKDGKKELWSAKGDHFLEGTDFSRYQDVGLTLEEEYEYGDMADGWLVRFTTPQGNMYIRMADPWYEEFGPYEYLYPMYRAFAYKKDGKWGLVKTDQSHGRIKCEPFLPNRYQAIYEVCSNEGLYGFYLVKENDRWKAVSRKDGHQEDFPARRIAEFMNLPSTSRITLTTGQNYIIRRSGNDQVGIVFINATRNTKQEYDLWFH